MKLLILSDLHNEVSDFADQARAIEVDYDAVVLAGDIHHKGRAVEWALRAFPDSRRPVIMVLGNHDVWGCNLSKIHAAMKKDAEGTHIHLLERDEVVIDGVRFLGATAWTDYGLQGNKPLAMYDASRFMNDFRKIRIGPDYKRLRPEDLAYEHASFRGWLKSKREEAFTGKTVVVTHHAPSSLSIEHRYRNSNDLLSSSYASELAYEMEGVALWVHGHTHDSFDYQIGDTRVICNPRGYVPFEDNEDFDLFRTISI